MHIQKIAVQYPLEQKYKVQLTDDLYGFVSYRKQDGVLFLDHAEIPLALRGKSFAASLMEAVLHLIERQELKIIPVCPYIKSYVALNKQWSHLLA